MSNGCIICGKRDYLHFEGFDYPEWDEEHYTDRDRAVGIEVCSVEHLIAWFVKKGFEIPDQDEIEEALNMDKELKSWTEEDEMGTEKEVTVTEKNGKDEIEITTHFSEPGITNSVTIQDTERLEYALKNVTKDPGE